MRDLYDIVESILDDFDDDDLDKMTDQIQVIEWVEKYLKPHNPRSQFEVTANGIIRDKKVGKNTPLTIKYDGFDVLPDFVKFDDCAWGLVIIECERGTRISSFRGIPTTIHNLQIRCGYQNGFVGIQGTMPELKVHIINSIVVRASGVQSLSNLDVECDNHAFISMYLGTDSLQGLHIHGGKDLALNFVNDGYVGDKISKLLARKAVLNKYRNRFETPITDEGLKALEGFFAGVVDLKNVRSIGYTQASCVIQHNGEWYRCKNW